MTSHRILSAAIFFVLFLSGLFVSQLNWIVLVITLAGGLAGTWEFNRLTRTRPAALLIAPSMIAAAALILDGYGLHLAHAPGIIGAVAVLTLAGALILPGMDELAAVAGRAVTAPVYAALPLAMILRIWRDAQGPNLEFQNAGAYYILFLIIVTWASDTGAYFIGRWFGSRKILPRLSPGKTLEGYLGGFAFTLIVAVVIKLVWANVATLFAWNDVLILAVAFSIIAPIGDLAESALKRSAGVKDSGQTFTGHGGMLDIIDSLLFTAVFYYFYLIAVRPEALGAS